MVSLAGLVSLRHLVLCSNRLRSLGGPVDAAVAASSFLHLQSLDLSYNAMPAEEVLGTESPLAAMPR